CLARARRVGALGRTSPEISGGGTCFIYRAPSGARGTRSASSLRKTLHSAPDQGGRVGRFAPDRQLRSPAWRQDDGVTARPARSRGSPCLPSLTEPASRGGASSAAVSRNGLGEHAQRALDRAPYVAAQWPATPQRPKLGFMDIFSYL